MTVLINLITIFQLFDVNVVTDFNFLSCEPTPGVSGRRQRRLAGLYVLRV